MFKKIIPSFLIALVAVVFLSSAVYAMDLTDAKEKGLVGEMSNGLIGIVKNADGVDDLVQTVNAGRTVIYKKNATEQNIDVKQVQSIAGAKLQSATPPGMFIQKSNGTWVKK